MKPPFIHYISKEILQKAAKGSGCSDTLFFVDDGISGTQAAKRPQFLRMIRQCRQKKIDMVLVKSIFRFARNTVDCLNYVRALRELGIAIIFEEQNINTLESDGELLITLLGAVSQGENEAISENVKWGKRQTMREGKATIQYKRLYAYEKGPDGKPRIIPEQAEVVRQIYDSFLGGQSLRMIKDALEAQAVPTVSGGSGWSIAVIRGILQNEKYCGDVLQQKSFVADCISHRHVRNVGQLPMYLTRDHHEGIVSRNTFHAAINSVMSRKDVLVEQIEDAMRTELVSIPGESMSLSDIDRRLVDLDWEFKELFQKSKEAGGYLGHADAFKRITEEMGALKDRKAFLLVQMESGSAANRHIRDAVAILSAGNPRIAEWDESVIRQLVNTMDVLSADRIRVCLRAGMEIEQSIEGAGKIE